MLFMYKNREFILCVIIRYFFPDENLLWTETCSNIQYDYSTNIKGKWLCVLLFEYCQHVLSSVSRSSSDTSHRGFRLKNVYIFFVLYSCCIFLLSLPVRFYLIALIALRQLTMLY